MTNPYKPSDQLLTQITVLEKKINEILKRNKNKDTNETKRYKKFIKDKKSLLCKLNNISAEMKYTPSESKYKL